MKVYQQLKAHVSIAVTAAITVVGCAASETPDADVVLSPDESVGTLASYNGCTVTPKQPVIGNNACPGGGDALKWQFTWSCVGGVQIFVESGLVLSDGTHKGSWFAGSIPTTVGVPQSGTKTASGGFCGSGGNGAPNGLYRTQVQLYQNNGDPNVKATQNSSLSVTCSSYNCL